MRIYEDFLDDFGAVESNAVQRIQKASSLVLVLNPEQFKVKLVIELHGMDNDEYDIEKLEKDFNDFVIYLEGFLDSLRKIEDYAIEDQPKKNIPLNGWTNADQFLRFAFNHHFDRFTDIMKFFYGIASAANRFGTIFDKNYVSNHLSGSKLSNSKIYIRFYISNGSKWESVTTVKLETKEMFILKKNNYSFTKNTVLYALQEAAAPLLYDERKLPDYMISPQQAGFIEIEETFENIKSHLQKVSDNKYQIITIDCDELVGREIDG